MPELSSYLLIGAVAAVVTFVMTPVVGWLATRRGWVYLPNDRTVHQTPLPDVGGLAMFVGFVAALDHRLAGRRVRRRLRQQLRAARCAARGAR